MGRLAKTLACVVLLALCVALAGCAPSLLSLTATELTARGDLATDDSPICDTLADPTAEAAVYDFSARLFRECVRQDSGDNVFVSPLSVLYALALAENGAAGQTLAQLEAATGMSMGQLTDYLNAYARRAGGEDPLDAGVSGDALELSLANSVWLRDSEGLVVGDEFLAACGERLGAQAYRAAFDQSTVDDVNAWVSDRTHGMIPEMLSQIPASAQLCLINALAFEGAWEEPYDEEGNIEPDVFTTEEGVEQDVRMMLSREQGYLESDLATGFIKPYENYNYAFVGILPNEGVTVGELLESLDGTALRELLTPVEYASVDAGLPMFTTTYQTELTDALRALGVTDAFEAEVADFSPMGESDDGPLYVSQVVHKTYVDVNEEGTRAAAVTSVGMDGASGTPDNPVVNEVILDRPFVYLIVDQQTMTPIFMGVVGSIG